MIQKPLVSVVIPVYNSEKYIRQAIDSVLNQTYSNIEIITVDDGSKDSSLSILKEYETKGLVMLLQHEGGLNKGVSKTRKLGFSHAKGEFIALLDSDDCFVPEKIAKQIDVFAKHPETVLCHTFGDYLVEAGLTFPYNYRFRPNDFKYNLFDLEDRLTQNPVFNSSVLVRANVLNSVDLEMPQLFQFEDWIAWLLCAQHGDFYYLNEPLCNYRYHENSATFKVFNNILRDKYTWIEFYLCLLGKFDGSEFVTEVYDKLDGVLQDLACVYNDNETAKSNLSRYLKKDQKEELRLAKERIRVLEITLKNKPITRLLNLFSKFLKK